MRNIMTLCGVLLSSIITIAQGVDSTNHGNTNIQDQIYNSTDTINTTPQTQEPISPTGQPLLQPQIQSDTNLQSQPEVYPQPIQPQPQVPTQPQSHPLDPNNPVLQNQLNQGQLDQSVQPIQPPRPSTQPVNPTSPPTPTGPAPLGTHP